MSSTTVHRLDRSAEPSCGLRRADGQKDEPRRRDRRGQVGREVQPLGLDVVLDQFGQARLVDRNFAAR